MIYGIYLIALIFLKPMYCGVTVRAHPCGEVLVLSHVYVPLVVNTFQRQSASHFFGGKRSAMNYTYRLAQESLSQHFNALLYLMHHNAGKVL